MSDVPASVIDDAQPADTETENPASSEPEVDTTETLDDEQETEGEQPDDLPKGVKKRIDKLTRAKHELTRQNLEAQLQLKELKEKIAQLDTPKEQAEPDPSQYDDWDKYLADKVSYEAGKQLNKIQQEQAEQASQAERFQRFNQRAQAIRQQAPDFDDVLQGAQIPVSDTIRDTVIDAEDGPAIAYYLAKNPLELLRINTLNERQQVLELGKLSARLSAKPEPKRVTSAPEPIKPPGRSATPPKRLEDAQSMEEYAAMRRKQMANRR